MNLIVLLLIFGAVGLAMGAVAGPLFRSARPHGLGGDLAIGVVVSIGVALLDWFIIPAMGFSPGLMTVALIVEPALVALLVLWLVRYAQRA